VADTRGELGAEGDSPAIRTEFRIPVPPRKSPVLRAGPWDSTCQKFSVNSHENRQAKKGGENSLSKDPRGPAARPMTKVEVMRGNGRNEI